MCSRCFFTVFIAIACATNFSACRRIESEPLLSSSQRDVFTSLSLDKKYIKDFPKKNYWIATVSEQGKFYLDTSRDAIKGSLARGNPWEPEADQLIYHYTKPGTVALDIGAHIGTHTIALSRAVGKNGVVIAFEPQKKICRELHMNLLLNGCTNTIPIHCALGDKDGQVGLVTPRPGNEGGTYVGGGKEIVSVKRLDDFGIRNISFIKMDVENYEDMVLAGAFTTLTNSRPFMLLEIQGNWDQLHEAGGDYWEKTCATIATLEKLGYTAYHCGGSDYFIVPNEEVSRVENEAA